MGLRPTPLTRSHDLSDFSSSEPELDDWLRRRALQNQLSGASRTYVVVVKNKVVAYYALASGSVMPQEAPGRIRRNMPDPIPVVILGRLAVTEAWQGKGLGKALLRDAILRTLQVAEKIGIRAILVHALHEQAAAFYQHLGFLPSPMSKTILVLSLKDAQAICRHFPVDTL
ncbi:MAG: GNAT family N-acetyltransferase [Candidatus Pacebacteria bacterium]|nr:GNAT family N-acetyltransferase [Candidatus Paceibacterota bacterium]PIR59815.1 MAG: GNAT family N-acetyltransferase [Candidatus Pacebacteria bacterium CG10_big_fil_rev_8_21_14_0_10_45_6]